jgi:Ribbon-helix-helix protein, copG family
MRTIDDGDVLREYNTRDLVQLFQAEILAIHKSDVDDWEADLMTGQYAYVKFGLLLERIRNGSWWNRCQEKFSDFRSFCQSKINLNIWQVINAIKSANVAVKLAQLGFDQLPRNASQALKLADLSLDRLAEVWGNILKSCEAHKITALAIESQINPDKQSTNSTIKLPRELLEKLQREAIDSEISLKELIEELLADRVAANNYIEPVECDMDEIIPEVINDQDRQFKAIDSIEPVEPKKIIEAAVDSFDRMMNDLIGQFIPPVKTVANE